MHFYAENQCFMESHMQSLAVQITVVVSLVVVACFVWVLLNSKGVAPLEQVAKPAYQARSFLFFVAIAAGIAISFFTLVPWPHDANAAAVTRQIDAKARQWAWELSDNKARVGEVVEFRVSAEDVNHGFALYDPDKRMVAQIQAMPGFVNKVRHRFVRPGTYQLLCLEYCGVAHHAMIAEITVGAAASN